MLFRSPAVGANCRFIVIDADIQVLRQSIATLKPARVASSHVADAPEAAQSLISAASKKSIRTSSYTKSVQEAVAYRPAAWQTQRSQTSGALHALEIGRAVQPLLDKAGDPIFVSDGGEIGQWAQATIRCDTRLINGLAGSIGSAIPFAMAARVARPNATVIATLGDGTFGFHMAEFDTAARHKLPFVAVIGNDSAWNAEYQIQLRSYGKDRAVGCELAPSAAYEQAVVALGGHGERVTRAEELPAALERALKSGKPACVNVMIERLPAPNVTRVVQ